jgi:thiol-disulfide isomerase/thioredoxin
VIDDELWLSCFDGGHAFLMRAKQTGDGTLTGDFWSGNWWHETWTARRDEQAALPSAFELSTWNEQISLEQLHFPDLDGHERSIIGDDQKGHPLIIEIFGSWCPNCHDAGKYLSEIDQRYHDRGLRVLGLAFELTGDLARDAAQVRKYQQRHALSFPIFIGGLADKEKASQQFPALDRIRAYPTLIFVNRDGSVKAVYTGFSGPAAGETHLRLRERFETIIEAMLE